MPLVLTLSHTLRIIETVWSRIRWLEEMLDFGGTMDIESLFDASELTPPPSPSPTPSLVHSDSPTTASFLSVDASMTSLSAHPGSDSGYPSRPLSDTDVNEPTTPGTPPVWVFILYLTFCRGHSGWTQAGPV